RANELRLAGAHQLRMSNTTNAYRSVKTERRETGHKQKLLGIHYCFARALQEKKRLSDKLQFVVEYDKLCPTTLICCDNTTSQSLSDIRLRSRIGPTQVAL